MNGWLSLSGPRVSRTFWTIAAVLVAAAPALAAAGAPEIRIDPTTLYFGGAPAARNLVEAPEPPQRAFSRPAVAKALRDKAASTGAARVVVQLAMPFSPEGRLATAQAAVRPNTRLMLTEIAATSSVSRIADRPSGSASALK